MNRHSLSLLVLFCLGLFTGLIVDRYFVPERYGTVTMFVLIVGGIATGALLMWVFGRRAPAPASHGVRELTWAGSSSTDTTIRPRQRDWKWQMQLGERRVTLQWQPNWWSNYRQNSQARLESRTAAGKFAWFEIALLFGAVALALYGQYALMDAKTWTRGIYAYVVAVICFVSLILVTEPLEQPAATVSSALPDAKESPTHSRVRLVMIGLAVIGAALVTLVSSTKAWNEPQTANIVSWFGVMLLFASAFVPWARVRQSLWNFQGWARAAVAKIWGHKLEVGAVAGIVAIAFLARDWRLTEIPGIFGGDEGEMGTQALMILNGELKNPFITGWLSHSTMFFYLQSWSLRFFGQTEYGLRLLGVLGGTLSVLVAFLLVRRLFTTRLALITAALLAVYNYHIHFSRLALDNIFDSLLAPLVLLLSYIALKSRRPAYFAAAGMAMGVSFYFYQGMRLIPVILIVFGLYLLLTERDLILKNWVNFIWFILGVFVVAGPLLYFYYTHPNDFMARLTERGIFQSGWFAAQVANGTPASQVLLDQVRKSFLAFNGLPDPTEWFRTGLPLLDPLSGMLLVFGIVYAVLCVKTKSYALMLIWIFLGIFLGSTLLENPPTSPSFVIVVIPAIFFVALGLERLVAAAGRVLPRLARVQWQIAAGFVFLFALWSLSFYFIDYAPRNNYGGEPNWVVADMVNYLKPRTDPYRVYFVAPPYIYLNIGSRKFLMPHLEGEDVLKPIASGDDLGFVNKSKEALFVFVPARVQELPIVQQAYPNGTLHNFNKPNGQLLFAVYEVPRP